MSSKNERWCSYPGCADKRPIARGKNLCPYHELIFANASDELTQEVTRTIEVRRAKLARSRIGRQLSFEFMTSIQRKKIKAAAQARWRRVKALGAESEQIDFMKTIGEPTAKYEFMKHKAQTKNGAEGKSAPMEIPTANSKTHQLAGKSWTLEIEHARIRRSETNPRTVFEEEALKELAADFKLNGQLQALAVRVDPKWAKNEAAKRKAWSLNELRALDFFAGTMPLDAYGSGVEQAAIEIMQHPETRYEIIIGERRWRAAAPKYAGLKLLRCTVQHMTDDQVIKAQYAENDKRKDISTLEEARFFAKLVDSGQYTPDGLAVKLNKSRTHIFEKLKIARLTGEPMKAFEEGKISASMAAVISKVPDPEAQALLFRKDRWGNIPVYDSEGAPESVRAVEEWIDRNLIRQIPWKLDAEFAHAKLISKTCRQCPKMSRNIGEDPNAAKGPARCLALSCFEARTQAIAEERKKEAAEQGLEIWNAEKFSRHHYDSDYCVEGQDNYSDGKTRKWEKIAGDLPHAIVAEADDGKVLRVWRRADLVKAGLAEKQRSCPNGIPAKSAAEKRKEKEAAEKQRAVVSTIVARAELADPPDEEMLRLLTKAFLQSAWSETIRIMAKRRAVESEAMTEDEFVANLKPGECVGILVEGLCCCGMRGGDAGRFQQEALKMFGLDKKTAAKQKGAENGLGTFLEKVAGREVSASGHASASEDIADFTGLNGKFRTHSDLEVRP
jgi:ParB/RepB/Spo0J family partition protein